MLTDGLSATEIAEKVLPGFTLEVLDESETEYRCNCSKKRVETALISMGADELKKMSEDETTEDCCHFCDKKYTLSSDEIRCILKHAGT